MWDFLAEIWEDFFQDAFRKNKNRFSFFLIVSVFFCNMGIVVYRFIFGLPFLVTLPCWIGLLDACSPSTNPAKMAEKIQFIFGS